MPKVKEVDALTKQKEVRPVSHKPEVKVEKKVEIKATKPKAES